MSTLIVPSRFCGPPVSGNGGWTAGELASHLTGHLTGRLTDSMAPDGPADRAEGWPPVRVRLRQPPPLDVTMAVADVEGTTTLLHEGAVVAEAVPAVTELLPVAPVAREVAQAAETTYAGQRQHPFPTCFACGPERAEGDGLRIFPGEVESVEGRRRVAATWTPHPSLSEDWHLYQQAGRHAALPVTWAALDCVGGWAEDLLGRPMVLGQMTARVDALPEVGVPHVVVGEHRSSEGRRTITASTLYAPDGAVVGLAEHVWVAVDPARFS